tara:strand:- start:3607 stop:4020 length:414 start_codon:yes stop_codon:yes gene_type:complete
MRIWVDDERDPTLSHVQEKFGARGNEIWVKTPAEFWYIVKDNLDNVESISFDNDLGLFLDTSETAVLDETSPLWRATEGRHIMAFLEELAFYAELPRMELHVHTANNVARDEMLRAIAQIQKFWRQSGDLGNLPGDG